MHELSPYVFGIDVDAQTRCAHYHSALDVIAIKMRCCGRYFACKDCHDAAAKHSLEVWPHAEWGQPAVLCGVCRMEMSVQRYLDCGNTCPACNAQFNPKCRNHYAYYFEWADSEQKL